MHAHTHTHTEKVSLGLWYDNLFLKAIKSLCCSQEKIKQRLRGDAYYVEGHRGNDRRGKLQQREPQMSQARPFNYTLFLNNFLLVLSYIEYFQDICQSFSKYLYKVITASKWTTDSNQSYMSTIPDNLSIHCSGKFAPSTQTKDNYIPSTTYLHLSESPTLPPLPHFQLMLRTEDPIADPSPSHR